MMQGVGDRVLPGAAAVSLVGGVSLLHPQDQVFAAMLDGWGRQQQSRFLAPSTILRDDYHATTMIWSSDY